MEQNNLMALTLEIINIKQHCFNSLKIRLLNHTDADPTLSYSQTTVSSWISVDITEFLGESSVQISFNESFLVSRILKRRVKLA